MSKSVYVYSAAEKAAITNCARGVQGARGLAVAMYRKSMLSYGMRRGDPYFDFMSEVDSPCPDLGLRAYYRKIVLELDH
jgi:hypothetical protein